MNNEIIYFELNNWFSGIDYPPEEPFETWIITGNFSNDEWCKTNKLVVLAGCIDMSFNWCIAATKQWIEENCPNLLSDKTFTTTTIRTEYDKEIGGMINKTIYHTNSYKDFIREPDKNGEVYGRFDWLFREYKPENFGVEWIKGE